MLKISEVKSDFRHLTRHIQDTSLILVDTGGMVEISSEEAQVNADKYLKYVWFFLSRGSCFSCHEECVSGHVLPHVTTDIFI